MKKEIERGSMRQDSTAMDFADSSAPRYQSRAGSKNVRLSTNAPRFNPVPGTLAASTKSDMTQQSYNLAKATGKASMVTNRPYGDLTHTAIKNNHLVDSVATNDMVLRIDENK